MNRADVLRRAQRALGASVLASGILSTGAFAALPASLDRIPTDALAVVVSPSVDRLDKNAAALLTAIEMPAVTSPAQLLSVVGLSRGIDTTKPVALALMAGDLGGDLPPAVLLLPVSDYAAVAQSLRADDPSGKITSGMVEGEAVYIKQVPGGYAAISPVRTVLESFSGDGGLLGAHEKNLGAMGVRVVEASDAALIANIPALAPLIGPGLENFRNGMLPMLAAQGGLGADAMENSPIDLALKNFLRDGQVGVLGLRASGMGLSATLSATFKPDSELARIFESGGNSAPLMGRLPDAPFLYAYALDLSGATARTLIGNAKELRASAVQEGQDPEPAMPGVMTLIDNLSGQSGMVMPNPAGLMGGLLARGVYFYESPSPDAVIDGYRTILTDLNGRTVNGLSYSGVVKDGSKVGDREVVGYSLRAQAAPGSMAANSMGMIFGPAGGPSGFMGKAGGGVVVTTAPDQGLMSLAMSAAGGAKTLGENRMLKQVQANLPEKRMFEAYISPRPILDQAMPFLAMMGQPIDQGAVPAELPPIGFSVSAEGGAMRFDTFVPAPVIKTGVAIGQSLQSMMGQRGGNNGAPAQPQNNPPF